MAITRTLPQLAAPALALLVANCAHAPAQQASAPTPEALLGTWNIALYYATDQPPSATVLEITAANPDGTLNGSFYQTPFEIGRYTLGEDEIILSVVTSDGSGPYATSGRLSTSGVIEGQTLSTGRDFLMRWTGVRRAD